MNGKFLWQGDLFYKFHNPFDDVDNLTKITEKSLDDRKKHNISSPDSIFKGETNSHDKSYLKLSPTFRDTFDTKIEEIKDVQSKINADLGLDALIENQFNIEENYQAKKKSNKIEEAYPESISVKSQESVKSPGLKNTHKNIKLIKKASTFLSCIGLLNGRNLHSVIHDYLVKFEKNLVNSY